MRGRLSSILIQRTVAIADSKGKGNPDICLSVEQRLLFLLMFLLLSFLGGTWNR